MDRIPQIPPRTLQVPRVTIITVIMEVTATPPIIPPRRTQLMQQVIRILLATTHRTETASTLIMVQVQVIIPQQTAPRTRAMELALPRLRPHRPVLQAIQHPLRHLPVLPRRPAHPKHRAVIESLLSASIQMIQLSRFWKDTLAVLPLGHS